MKKLLLVLILILVCIFTLSACEDGNTNAITQESDSGSHIHSFDEWETIKTATCTSEGKQERYCQCGESQTKVISKSNHNFGDWKIVKTATCTTKGSQERTCTCGYTDKCSIDIISCEEKNGLCYMCHKTINPFNALKCYVMTNGSKLSSGHEYLYTDETYTNSRGCTTYIEYNDKDDEFTIGILIQMQGNMSIYTTNVIDVGNTTQKLQMQYREDGRYHYCSANVTTDFCNSNKEMTSKVYRGVAPSLQEDMFELLNESALIMLSAVNETLNNLNFDISLSDFGYIYYK